MKINQQKDAKMRFGFVMSAIIMFFGACQTDHDQGIVDQATSLEGIWLSEGYGRLLWIREGKAKTYDISGAGCMMRGDFFDVAGDDVSVWNVTVAEDRNHFLYHAQATVNTYVFNKIDALPGICDDGGLKTTDPLTNFDYLWALFNEHYAFFQAREIDWGLIREHYREQVTDENLWDITTEMLSVFGDDHVTLYDNQDRYFQAGQQRLYVRFYEEYVDAGEPGGDFEQYIQQEYGKVLSNISNYLPHGAHVGANGKVLWGKANEETGYLQIAEMNGLTEPYDLKSQVPAMHHVMDRVVNDFEDCTNVIIDIRFNSGGLDIVSLALAGRFASKQQPVWKVSARDVLSFTPTQVITLAPTGNTQLTKNVVVLTSNFTASAAETFALAMKQLPNVTIIGERTNGIFSTMLNKKMPNGWTVTLSNERWADASDACYEVSGITPHIEAPFPSKTNRDDGIDPVLLKALEYLE
ncbi:S41 family peptidase [Pseudochryseolinea flava]|uniref:Tail specific protease domain-containing protein n=1 Tax=Pseudochryseolinea flava TaxID=2059302 RepID=A0A364Y1B7_9BACT|nr:S41 family peptidase [Pseudochryseolinea flava]RAW00418.1 hypothetical protein DQQ10_15315 [Pseudochryseolinea flava]